MVVGITRVMGCVIAMTLIVAGLWCWGQSGRIAEDARRPELTLWATRSAALACAAGAQVLVLSFAVGSVYRLRRIDDALRLVACLICTAALLGTLTCLLWAS